MASEDGGERSSTNELLRLSVDIVGSYVGRNAVPVGGLPSLIGEVYAALLRVDASTTPDAAPVARRRPATPIGRSVQPDYIVCLEDGRKLKMLKRHLRSRYGLTPEEYRRKWGLAPDYPMVAPAYSERRSVFAKQIGLGRGVRRRS